MLNGDDWLVITKQAITAEEHRRQLMRTGQESSFCEAKGIEEVEFCQTIPWQVGGRTIFGPKLGRVLSRLPWNISGQNEDPRGVALGMMKACSFIPFLNKYLKHIADASPGVKAVLYDHHLTAVDYHEADASTYAFLTARYGLTKTDEEAFITLLSPCKLKMVAHWGRLEALVGIDE